MERDYAELVNLMCNFQKIKLIFFYSNILLVFLDQVAENSLNITTRVLKSRFKTFLSCD